LENIKLKKFIKKERQEVNDNIIIIIIIIIYTPRIR
jgi:hypothetical protein